MEHNSIDVSIFETKQWKDDQQMDVMFSPFRESRDINPISWDNKIKFWSETISHYLYQKNQIVFDSNLLESHFKRKGRSPLCFSVVLHNMHNTGQLKSLEQFFSDEFSGWASWSLKQLKRPISYSLSWVFGRLLGNEDKQFHGEFVIPEFVKKKADEILKYHRMSTNNTQEKLFTDNANVVSHRKLSELCRDLFFDEHNFDVALLYLEKKKKIYITENSEINERFVYFVAEDKSKVEPPSQLELQIIRLKATVDKLENQILAIDNEMEKCKDEARFYLKKSLRNSAKNALRKKKQLENRRVKKEESIANLNDLIEKIKDSETNKMIIDAYSSGNEALKHAFKSNGISADKVDDIVAEIQETFDNARDVSDALTGQGELFDTAENLEDELESILSGNSASSINQKNLNTRNLPDNLTSTILSDQLPDVPHTVLPSPIKAVPAKRTPLVG